MVPPLRQGDRDIAPSSVWKGPDGGSLGEEWSQGLDSNQRPTVLQTAALNQLSYPG